MNRTPAFLRQAALVALAGTLLAGCAHLALEDCGGKVIGEDQPRIRSSHLRMLLADPAAASRRLAPYALMSALAYAEDAKCGSGDPKLGDDERKDFESELTAQGWTEVRDEPWLPPACEDEVGLFFRVWTSGAGDPDRVVVAFRGTWGLRDWIYGNLHWLTRFLPMDDQYSNARRAMEQIVKRFSAPASDSHVQFYTTGHSLGGGLAQHALYSYPRSVRQAFAFDPSSVTGFADQAPEDQVAACACKENLPAGETRIYRVYTSYEILSMQRIFHKLLFPPERHIQELRFPNVDERWMIGKHSINLLAHYLFDHARGAPAPSEQVPWFAGQGQYTEEESCTQAFIRRQKESCDPPVDAGQRTRNPS